MPELKSAPPIEDSKLEVGDLVGFFKPGKPPEGRAQLERAREGGVGEHHVEVHCREAREGRVDGGVRGRGVRAEAQVHQDTSRRRVV